jgi:UDP-N-acetylmuramate dehydrogenase
LHGLETPREIYAGVIAQRTQKLPNPQDLPNAGSFFKNPILDKLQVAELQQTFPKMPVYPVDTDTQKVSAAWLIEQCGLKGKTLGGVGVYQHHALILVNHGNGSGEQLLALIDNICAAVKDKFKITLVCEVQVL